MSFDPGAFILSLIVASIVVFDFYRSRSVRLRIKKFETHANFSIAGSNITLELVLINIGRSLHDISAELRFPMANGRGNFVIKFRPAVLTDEEQALLQPPKVWKGEFGYGMLAQFELSINARLNNLVLLNPFKGASAKNASIVVYAQGFQARTFKPNSIWEIAKKRWNEFAYRMNATYGPPPTRDGFRIPTLISLERQLELFFVTASDEKTLN